MKILDDCVIFGIGLCIGAGACLPVLFQAENILLDNKEQCVTIVSELLIEYEKDHREVK